MKKFMLILAILASGSAFAQTKVEAVEAKIEMTPAKVYIPSTGDYVYLGKTTSGWALFISKDSTLFKRFANRGSDSLVKLQGAIFKPMNHYTKKQWRMLSKEIKIFFPAISHKELEAMSFYLIFNYSIEAKAPAVSSGAPVVNTGSGVGTGTNTGTGNGPVKIGR